MRVRRGEIYIAELNGFGAEQQGTRPVVIIQNDKGNTYSDTTIVVPVTSQSKRFNATHVDIDCLIKPSTVLCEHIRVLDKSKLKRKVAVLSESKMEEIGKKILVALAI